MNTNTKQRRTDIVDPAVMAAISDGERRQKLRQLPPAKRERVQQDEKRSKATYDLPDWLITAIDDLAEAERCSKSSVAAFLLVRALEAYQREEFSFDGYRRTSRSPRYDVILETPELGAREPNGF